MGTRSAEAELKITLNATAKNLLSSGSVSTASISYVAASGKLQNGVNANQINRIWDSVGRTISSGNTEDIDLYDMVGEDIGAGAGLDALGQAVLHEELVTIIIKQTGGTGRLEIMPSNPSSGPAVFLPKMTVALGNALKSGASVTMHMPDTDAFDVVDGVAHVARFGANGGPVTYDLVLVGRHDDEESSSSSSSSSSTSTLSTASSSSSSQSTTSTSLSTTSQSSLSTTSLSTSSTQSATTTSESSLST